MKDACTVLEMYIMIPIYEPTKTTNKNYGGLLARQDGPVEHENKKINTRAVIGLPLPPTGVCPICMHSPCIVMVWRLGAAYNPSTYQPT